MRDTEAFIAEKVLKTSAVDTESDFDAATHDILGITPEMRRAGQHKEHKPDQHEEAEMINALIKKTEEKVRVRKASQDLSTANLHYPPEWEPRIEALMLKFPDALKTIIIKTLVDVEGHAGKAERKLEKLAPKPTEDGDDLKFKPLGAPSASKTAINAKSRGAATAAAKSAGGRFVTDDEWAKVQKDLKQLKSLKAENRSLLQQNKELTKELEQLAASDADSPAGTRASTRGFSPSMKRMSTRGTSKRSSSRSFKRVSSAGDESSVSKKESRSFVRRSLSRGTSPFSKRPQTVLPGMAAGDDDEPPEADDDDDDVSAPAPELTRSTSSFLRRGSLSAFANGIAGRSSASKKPVAAAVAQTSSTSGEPYVV